MFELGASFVMLMLKTHVIIYYVVFFLTVEGMLHAHKQLAFEGGGGKSPHGAPRHSNPMDLLWRKAWHLFFFFFLKSFKGKSV